MIVNRVDYEHHGDLTRYWWRNHHTGRTEELWLVPCDYACGHTLLHGRPTKGAANKLRKRCSKRQCAACELDDTRD